MYPIYSYDSLLAIVAKCYVKCGHARSKEKPPSHIWDCFFAQIMF